MIWLIEDTASTDADYAGKTLAEDGKSTSKYVIFLAGGPICWSSKRQSYVTTSSTEAEYVGQANTIKHIVALCQFFTELRLPLTLPITLYTNNQSAISLSQNPKFHARTRHIIINVKKVENGVVKIVYKPHLSNYTTRMNPAITSPVHAGGSARISAY